jgi:hypothetical protein
VEDREGSGSCPDSLSTNESDGIKVLGETRDLLGQVIHLRNGLWEAGGGNSPDANVRLDW